MKISEALLPAAILIASLTRLSGASYDVGGRKQLFIDQKFIEQSDGIELHVNPPDKCGMVVSGANPWESGCIWGAATSVFEDQGKYRMWYTCCAPAARPEGQHPIPPWTRDGVGAVFLCYAESADGINWIKPNLGIFEWAGSTANNILMLAPVETGSGVFLDPKGPPEKRYKLVVSLHVKSPLWPYGNAPAGAGIYVLTSPDGLRWRLKPERVFPFTPDTANMALYDDRTSKYLAYVRIWTGGRRRVGVVEADDLTQPWPYDKSQPLSTNRPMGPPTAPGGQIPEAFGADDGDPPNVDHYTSAVVAYRWADDAYFMFPSAYRHFPAPPEGRFRNDGILDGQMAVSRDGRKFHRLSHSPYLEVGMHGSRDDERIYMGVGMLRRGNLIYQYYGGFDYTHGSQPDMPEIRNRGGIFLARQRIDGFVSADADEKGGQFATPVVVFQGERLVLNMDASATGEVLVELRDANGNPIRNYSFVDCDPLFENDPAKIVTWRHGDSNLAQLSGTPVRIAFRLRTAKLFAFQFSD